MTLALATISQLRQQKQNNETFSDKKAYTQQRKQFTD